MIKETTLWLWRYAKNVFIKEINPNLKKIAIIAKNASAIMQCVLNVKRLITLHPLQNKKLRK
jgi:hypothetical protein